jgi:hypothetical protein
MKPIIFLFLCCFGCMLNSFAQVTYYGNGNDDFGGAVGNGSLEISHTGTDINFEFTRGNTGDFNDYMVIYIDNGSAGRNVIDGNVNDTDSSQRRAVSNTNSGNLTFPAGFEATHALTLSDTDGDLFSIPATGTVNNGGLNQITGIASPGNANFANHTFSISWANIGLSSTDSFSFVVTYGNPNDNGTNMFSSDEAIGSISQVGNPGTGAFSFTSFYKYPSGDSCGLVTTDQSGNWSNTATWTNGVLPNTCSRVQINDNVTLDEDAEVANLEISSGQTLTSEASQGRVISITDGGTFTNNGTFTANDGKVIFTGAGSVGGIVTFNDVDISGSVNFGSDTTIDGELSILSGGAVDTNPPFYSLNSTLIYDTFGTLDRGDEWNNVGSPSNNQGTPHHVIIRSTNLQAGVNPTVDFFCNGNLTIENGAALTMRQPNEMDADLTIHGDLTNEGTLGTSQFGFDNSSDIIVKGDFSNNATGVMNFTTTFGNDLHLEGDFYDIGTMNYNNRALFFVGAGPDQNMTIDSASPNNIEYEIPFIVITDDPDNSGNAGRVIINKGAGIDNLVVRLIGENGPALIAEHDAALDLNGHELQIGNGGNTEVAMGADARIIGHPDSKLVFNSTSANAGNILRFSQTGTENELSDFEIDGGGEIHIANPLEIRRRVVLNNGEINSDGNLIFLSDATRTAVISPAADGTFDGTISGDVEVHRHFPHTGLQRSFRYISSSVNTAVTITKQSIHANWQEGAQDATTGNPYTDPAFNPHPEFGTHITGEQGTIGNVANNGLDETETGNHSLWIWNENIQDWVVISNTIFRTLDIGDTFALMVRGDRSASLSSNFDEGGNPATLRTTGELHGTANFDLYDFSINSFNPGDTDKFVLIGNPYQAEVDMKEVIANSSTTGVNPSYIWVWYPSLTDKGGYVVVDLDNDTNDASLPASNINEFLQPFHAVFVQVTAVDSEVVFQRNNIKNDVNNGTAQTTVFSNPENNNNSKLEINLYRTQDNLLMDAIRLNFADNYSNGVSYEDAIKFWNYDENLAIMEDNAYVSINKRQWPTHETYIPLYLSGYTQEQYHFDISLEGIPDEVNVYLKDHYTNTFTALDSPMQTYSFSVDSSIPESLNTQRFELFFKSQTLSSEALLAGRSFHLYPNPTSGKVYLQVPNELLGQHADISCFDMSGRQLLSRQLDQLKVENILDLGTLTHGIYLVKVETAQKTSTFKIRVAD